MTQEKKDTENINPTHIYCFVCKKDVPINDYHQYYGLCKKCMDKAQGI